MKITLYTLAAILIGFTAAAQPACVTFSNIDSTFTSPTSNNQIIYSEAGIDFRYIKGDDILGTPMIIIDSLNQWSGQHGNDNFSGHKLFYGWAETHILFNNLALTQKTITIDYNSYNGDKVIISPVQVWAQGTFTTSYDTTSLTNGGILTITGNIDSIKIGAYNHNDYVIDNVCASAIVLGINDIPNSKMLHLYPNPSTSVLNVTENLTEGDYSIYTLAGKLISEGKLATNQIDISTLAPASYFLYITKNGQRSNGHFLKK